MRTGVGLALLMAISWPDPASSATANQQKVDLLRRLVAEPQGAERPARLRAATSPSASCTRHAWWRRSRAALRLSIEESIQDASALEGVSPTLLRAVIRVESNYDPDAISRTGAQGLMQLMPQTAQALGVVCAFDPRENVLAGTRYLRRQYERFGNWPDALAAYNAGPGRVERREPLPAETRAYVREVLSRAPALRVGGR